MVLGKSDPKLWKCQICQVSNADLKSEGKPQLGVDHDHLGIDGNKACVRGALCHSCNLGIANFADTLKSFMDLKDAIIAYLKTQEPPRLDLQP